MRVRSRIVLEPNGVPVLAVCFAMRVRKKNGREDSGSTKFATFEVRLRASGADRVYLAPKDRL